LAAGFASSARADEAVPREHHPWGRFKPGSWKQVRVVTETFDRQGKLIGTSKQETTSTLVESSKSGYVLEIEVTVEVTGKRITSKPQELRQGFNGELEGQKLISLRRLGPSKVQVEGREITSDVRQVVVNGGDQKRTTTIHYCSEIEPYVLKRETSTTDAAGQTTLSQSVVEVVALDVPLEVLGEPMTACNVKTTLARPAGKTITLETHCLDVPGSLVSATSKELDEEGRVIKQSTVELVNFDISDGSDDKSKTRRRGLFNRRTRKTSAPR
jgi:hypothetical protein